VLVIATALVIVYAFVTTRTVIGRQIYAVGGNAKAAKLSGIKAERLAFLNFVNMACRQHLPALSLPRGTATPKAGLGIKLDVIAACCIAARFIRGASA
jgi:putative multiple sugar transport system permease protein